jgi:hypothetical protein
MERGNRRYQQVFFGDDDYLACVEMLMEWREIQGGILSGRIVHGVMIVL